MMEDKGNEPRVWSYEVTPLNGLTPIVEKYSQ